MEMWSQNVLVRQEISSMERVSAQCMLFLNLGRFNVIQGQRSWCQSIAQEWFSIQLPLTQASYLSPFSQYLTCTMTDLELAQFKVIQGKSS